MGTTFIPDPQIQSNGRVVTHNDHFYRDQVTGGGPFDTSFAFRWATASALDKARNNLIDAVGNEARQLRQEQASTLSGFVSDGATDFRAEVNANVMATRSIDGVEGAPDDAIKL